MDRWQPAWIGVGSNLEDPQAQVLAALDGLREQRGDEAEGAKGQALEGHVVASSDYEATGVSGGDDVGRGAVAALRPPQHREETALE